MSKNQNIIKRFEPWNPITYTALLISLSSLISCTSKRKFIDYHFEKPANYIKILLIST